MGARRDSIRERPRRERRGPIGTRVDRTGLSVPAERPAAWMALRRDGLRRGVRLDLRRAPRALARLAWDLSCCQHPRPGDVGTPAAVSWTPRRSPADPTDDDGGHPARLSRIPRDPPRTADVRLCPPQCDLPLRRLHLARTLLRTAPRPQRGRYRSRVAR